MDILKIIYDFINEIFKKEYVNIVEHVNVTTETKIKVKKPFTKKITICY